MSELGSDTPRPTDSVGRILFGLSRALAIFGGAICGLTAIMVTISVTGRYLFAAPIPGDYDLTAIACGTAVFAFLPYCQMVRGNVMVDFFTIDMSPHRKAVLDGIGSLLYLLIAILFTWRFYYGGLEFHANAEVLANFNFYRWWTVPFDIACMIVLILVIVYVLSRDVAAIRESRA